MRPVPDLKRPPNRLALALVCALGLCGWSTTTCAWGKKAEAVAETAPATAAQVATEETPGVHATPDGFKVVEHVQVDEVLREAYARAIELVEQGRYAEGVAALERITAQAPGLTAAHINLGIAQSRAGDLQKAEASLKQALALNPRHPVAWNELGMVQRRSGHFAEARSSYQKALEVAPEFHFAQLNLAILCDVYLADATCALQHYLAYQKAVPDDRQAAIWVADVRARSGQKE